MKTFPLSSLRLILWIAAGASFGLRAQAITFTTDTTIGVFDTNYNGADIVITNCTVTVDGPHSFASLQVRGGGALTHTHNSNGLNLTINGDALIEFGGAINANGCGYGAGSGPGVGSSQGSPASGSGAGHGGYGGRGTSNTMGGGIYGSLLQPTDKGSSGGAGTGGSGGFGGGAIKLVVGGALQIKGGISADGANANNSRAGGGSGGSVWLSAQTVSGTGSISADGGAGEPIHGGGGGGGRIAIYFATNLFSGSIVARGGAGFVTGGAGTLYLRNTNQPTGLVLVDNGGRAGTNTVLSASERFDLTVRGRAVVSAGASGELTVGNLLVASNGFVASIPASVPVVLSVTATNNATIEAGGAILADGSGYNSANSGPGTGASINAGGAIGNVGSGGGHGGYGGAGGVGPGGGIAHGSLSAPLDFGARGGAGGRDFGGAGGGAIHLTVNRALVVNGRISANGISSAVPNSGGGSGGSVWIVGGTTTATLNGTGVISANGGAGNALGGGGGGGRIALQVSTESFSGTVTAYGGSGASWGGAGTIYRTRAQPAGPQGPDSIVVDNGGPSGTNTTFGSSAAMTVDLTVAGGAALVCPSTVFTIRNFLVASNAVLIVTNLGPVFLTVERNATIEAGGWIKGDGEGSFPVPNSGGVASSSAYGTTGGGGGNGGNGSPSLGGAVGGSVSPSSPTGPQFRGGSGAPTVTSGPPQGGAGGAAIRLIVGGALLLDGRLSADGHDGYALHSGGGAGGSIWLTVGTFAGKGLISANGGRGNGVGGSGGGGRISIGFTTNLFSGEMAAHGGHGITPGGAGTIFSQRNNQSSVGPQLIVDNGGPVGTPSPLAALPQIGSTDLILKGGAQATLTVAGFAAPSHNLLIGSNAWLLVSNLTFGPPIVFSNATILAGGGISADGSGSASGTGQGAGRTTNIANVISGSGGGHGGAGGNSGGGAIGGASYDSASGPTIIGSGGGAGRGTPTNTVGGRGGGAVSLTVFGKLQLDGSISAEGAVGIGLDSGGGSGGSIALAVGTLSGSGRISVNGGAGNGSGGGGGGGGRIAVSYATNTFAGVVSAFGGRGFVWGGAGTIYCQSTKQNIAQLLVDNGGQQGAATSYSPYQGPMFDLSLQHGAMAAFSQASIRNLFIGSNSWLLVSNLVSGQAVLTGDTTIEAGGGINADGPSAVAGQGVGVGATLSSQTYGTTGGGGGHGGFGGASSIGAAGGNSYDSITTPSLVGSDGGGSVAGANAYLGGAGGRAFSLIRGGNLHLDGRISADGQAGHQHGGGGSGGSLWLDVRTLSGAGIISANGGAGGGVGGGGGGGRIALSFTSNSFTGTITAHGGPGVLGTAGAGTIYTKAGNQSIGQVLVDNGGLFGTNTPVANIGIFDLTVTGGAVAYPSNSFLILSNLFVNRDGLVTSGPGQTNLELAVLNNVVVGAGSAIAVNGLGFGQGNGPGAGLNAGGSGGGYGGAGGASATAPGGPSYGSATQPVDPGSGGGFGSGPRYGGSQGGGAIRLNVGGTLTVDGGLSANGIPGFQDGSGGGSGGSIRVNARTVRGNGFITADGGEGELFGGGGGGGGRVAIYYLTNPGHTNNFTGDMTAYGGEGFYWGDDGSVFFASGMGGLQVVSQTPNGVVSNVVSSVDLVFSEALNPFSVSSADVIFTTPNGPLAAGFLTVSRLSPSSLRISFPEQVAAGNYTFTIGPQIEDLYNRPMAQAYTGAFTISLPAVATIGPSLSGELQGTNFFAIWHGLPGLTYRLYYSTNLVNWLPYGEPVAGSNVLVQMPLPLDGAPKKFFRVQANN